MKHLPKALKEWATTFKCEFIKDIETYADIKHNLKTRDLINSLNEIADKLKNNNKALTVKQELILHFQLHQMRNNNNN